MASFRCYDNSHVIATLIITNVHLYLIQLWLEFFQIFVYGDVVYAKTWELVTLKNCVEPPLYVIILANFLELNSKDCFKV